MEVPRIPPVSPAETATPAAGDRPAGGGDLPFGPGQRLYAQVLQLVGYRDWWNLLHFLVGIVVCAVIARHYGMLSEHKFVPHIRMPHRERKPKRPKRAFDTSRPTVVTGPWEPREPQVSRDEARMNALLDKIHAQGQASLTEKEQAELLELRDRLRRR